MQRRVWVGVALGVILAGAAGCGGTSPAAGDAAASPPTISATGTGAVSGAASSGSTLNVNVQVRSEGSDTKSAVEQLQGQVDAVKKALAAAGVPAAGIDVGNFNLGPQYGPSEGKTGGPGPITGYMLNENLTVRLADASQLPSAMTAAVGAGATNVNSNKGGSQQAPPGPDTLAPAIDAATKQAEAQAAKAAAAAGVGLGALHSVSVAAPQYTYDGPGIGEWRVQVTVAYDLARK